MYYALIQDITNSITNKYVKKRILFLAKQEILENYNNFNRYKNSEQEKKYLDCVDFIENSNDYNSCKLWATTFFRIVAENFISYFHEEYEKKSFLNLIKETENYIINIHNNPIGYPKTFLDMINIDYIKNKN